jgi:hypothetical protein
MTTPYRDSPLRGRSLSPSRPLLPARPGYIDSPLRPRLGAAASAKAKGPQVIVKQPGAATPKPTNAPAGVTAGAYSSVYDPILQQIKALSQQSRENAKANATALRKQLAIAYGDASIVPDLNDESVTKAAADNPFSVRALLKRDYEKSGVQLDEDFNNSNLFYSGARANALGDNSFDYQNSTYSALGDARSQAQSIYQQLLAALMGADMQDIQAQWDANGRSQAEALANGTDPGAGLEPSEVSNSGLAPSDVPPPEAQAAQYRSYTALPGRGSQELGEANPNLNLGNIGSIAAGSAPAPSPIVQAMIDEERRRRQEALLG